MLDQKKAGAADRYIAGLWQNKCGSGHRKLRVFVIKKPLWSWLICYFSLWGWGCAWQYACSFVLRFFVHLFSIILILMYPLFRHNCLIYTHIRTYRRTNTRLEYIYWVYSRRSTTFVFRCSLNSWFLTIFDIFSRDRQTDRPTRVGIEAPSPELNMSIVNLGHFQNFHICSTSVKQ